VFAFRIGLDHESKGNTYKDE